MNKFSRKNPHVFLDGEKFGVAEKIHLTGAKPRPNYVENLQTVVRKVYFTLIGANFNLFFTDENCIKIFDPLSDPSIFNERVRSEIRVKDCPLNVVPICSFIFPT